MFRVDILNAMGFAVLVLSGLAGFTTAARVRMGARLGCFRFAALLVLDELRCSPSLRTYIVPDALAFGFFPWGAFVAFGMSAGSVIRLGQRDKSTASCNGRPFSDW